MTNTLNAIEMASALNAATGNSIIVLNLINNGSSSRWHAALPSLSGDELNAVDEVMFMTFDNASDANIRFNELIDGLADEHVCLISGTISLISSEDEPLTWDVEESTRPLWSDMYGWGNDNILHRL